jgi:hypothetical protein
MSLSQLAAALPPLGKGGSNAPDWGVPNRLLEVGKNPLP